MTRSANVLDGKALTSGVCQTVKRDAAAFFATTGQRVGRSVVVVGDDPASHAYVRAKARMANECGFKSDQHLLPATTSQRERLSLVEQLNDDPLIHGILVQLPLPASIVSEAIIQSIRPENDVDGLHVLNAGKLAVGDFCTGNTPCTPAGAMRLVSSVRGPDLSGMKATVIGRSNLFGKPMAQLLLNTNSTVTMAHSRSRALNSICRDADILVAAVGRPLMVKDDWVKPGATVIDVGINHIVDGEKRKLVGCQLCGLRQSCWCDHAGTRRSRAHDDRHADDEHDESGIEGHSWSLKS